MSVSARETYLAAEVLTAPPQKLHLLLVEAAIRACEKARTFWHDDKPEQAAEALIRAQEIMSELVAGLNRQADPSLVRQVASLYLFIYRNLLEATFLRDEKKLDDALRVLREERTTWQLVCQTGQEHSSSANGGRPRGDSEAPEAKEAPPRTARPYAPAPGPSAGSAEACPDRPASFSLDA